MKKNHGKLVYRNRYPLSARIYCGKDNEVFHRRKQCKASDDITWVCSKYLNDGKKKCDSPNIRESEVYGIFYDIIKILNINIKDVYNILFKLYKEKIKKIDEKIIYDRLLELLINKIVALKIGNNNIELKFYLNYKGKAINREYEYKRGYNTTGTKRYVMKYNVFFLFEGE